MSKQETIDGYLNFVTRLGAGGDKAGAYAVDDLTNQASRLESMYRSNWMAGTIVDCVAEDMTKSGVDFVGSLSAVDEARVQGYITRKGLWRALLSAIKWARLYGGAILVIDLDGQDTSAPLNLDTVGLGSLRGFRVYDRWACEPSVNDVVFSSFGEPQPRYYTLALPHRQSYGVKIHHSRVLRLLGNELPPSACAQNGFWGASVLERLLDRLVYFDSATAGAASLVQKAHLRIVQVDSLREILAAGGLAEENLLKSFQYMRYLQNNEGVTLLDKADGFNTHSYSFSGLDSMVLQFGQQLSGACGIPLVRLFGQSPVGLNSTGESDLRLYYDGVLSQQESKLRECLSEVFKVCYRACFGEPEPSDFDFNFKPLWQVSTLEKSQLAQSLSATVCSAYTAGIVDLETALQELKRGSVENDVFGSITEDKIKAAVFSEPPLVSGESSVENV